MYEPQRIKAYYVMVIKWSIILFAVGVGAGMLFVYIVVANGI